MYRVWYKTGNEWNMVNCSMFSDYALRVWKAHLNYNKRAYLEFIK